MPLDQTTRKDRLSVIMQDIDATRILTPEQIEQAATARPATAVDPDDGIPGTISELPVDESPEFRKSLPPLNRRYRLGELFAEGGFGLIFRAHDRFLDRAVIIKTLRPELTKNPEAVLKFLREAKLNARLDHPSIVPLYSLDGDDANGLHLAMKLVDGITMREFLSQIRREGENHRVSAAEEQAALNVRLEYFLKLCEAIAYAHTRGVVHCDLKPENIMVGRHGELYVMDWGSAALSGIARGRKIEGTPAYVAPETLKDETVTPAADIFALGMILYELVTLHRGVNGRSAREVLDRVKAGQFEPVRHFHHHLKIPRALTAIIERARHPDPAQRYRKVQDLADDIRHFLFNEEVSACPDGPLQSIARRMYKYRIQSLAAVATLLFLLAGLTAWSLYRENRSSTESNLRTLQRLALQRQTEVAAATINNLLLSIQEQLKAFGTGLSIEYDKPERPRAAEEIFFNQDYLTPETAPKDLAFSPIFNRSISMTRSACHPPAGMSREDATRVLRDLPMPEHGGLGLLLRGITAFDGTERAVRENVAAFTEKGGAIRRLSLLFNNGIGLRYPGMYEKIPPSRFQDEWIQELRRRNSRFFYWGLPRLDSANHLIFSCWGPLIDANGNEQGSIGVDVCFHEVVKHLYEATAAPDGPSHYYLINERDEIIFSSRQRELADHRQLTAQEAEQLPPLRKFPVPALLERIRNSTIRQAEYERDGRRYIVSWSPIAATKWLLVQVTDATRMPPPEIAPTIHYRTQPPFSPLR